VLARTAVGSGAMTEVVAEASPTVLVVSKVLMFLSATVCREVEDEVSEKKAFECSVLNG